MVWSVVLALVLLLELMSNKRGALEIETETGGMCGKKTRKEERGAQ